MPKSRNCIRDHLLIKFTERQMYKYCGYGTIEGEGMNVIINLNSQYYTKGGRFTCVIQTKKFEKNDCKCGQRNPSSIVGGEATEINEFPMMAGLVDSIIEIIYCGATIISQWHIITAAHCLTRGIDKIGVVVGEHDVMTGEDTNVTKVYRIKKCVIHPQYQDDYNDIAICQVIGEFQYSIQVSPVCLPFQHKTDSFVSSDVIILGWGLMEIGGKKSNELQGAQVDVISHQQCANSYHPTQIVHSQICTYTEEKDACQMDSGGPVLWQNPSTYKLVLIGVIANGVGCASGFPAVNMRVGNYIDWILSVTPGVQYCRTE